MIKFRTLLNIKGLSIESDNEVMGWEFEGFGIEGIEDNLLGPPYPKIGDGRIYNGFSRPPGFLPPLPHYICSGSNPILVETGQWEVYQGDIVLSPLLNIVFDFCNVSLGAIKLFSNWNTIFYCQNKIYKQLTKLIFKHSYNFYTWYQHLMFNISSIWKKLISKVSILKSSNICI